MGSGLLQSSPLPSNASPFQAPHFVIQIPVNFMIPPGALTFTFHSGAAYPVLRAFFISLSESRGLRAIAERSAIGQRLSSRFVAGTQVEDALRATRAVNQSGPSVSIDNLGENVTNADEARASAAALSPVARRNRHPKAQRQRQSQTYPHGS